MPTIDEIIEYLTRRKEKILVEDFENAEKKELLEISVEEKYKQELSSKKIKTGTLLDDLIGGGLEPKSRLLLYGEYGSGKTQTCFTIAVLCPDHVIYIDTENSFKATRIKQICDARGIDYKEVFKKIHLFQPKSWIEQMLILDKLPSPADIEDGRIGLIILDSLSKHFRGIEFAGRQSLSIKQPLIRECIGRLERIADAYNCALILTTQIYESPTANPFLPDWTGQKAVGGASLEHQPDYVVFLRKAQGNVRIARLMDASWQPQRERPFMITEKGIEDLPETKKAEKIIKKTEKFERQFYEMKKEKEN